MPAPKMGGMPGPAMPGPAMPGPAMPAPAMPAPAMPGPAMPAPGMAGMPAPKMAGIPPAIPGMPAPAMPAMPMPAPPMPGMPGTPPAMAAPPMPAPAMPAFGEARPDTDHSVEAVLDAMRAANGELDLAQLFPAPPPMMLDTVPRNPRAPRRFYFLPDAPEPALYVPMPDTGPGSGLGNCAYEGIEVETDA